MLKLNLLTKRFAGNLAVDGVSFEVKEGSITALIGPNGAGKTTCFNCIAGAIKPNAGSVEFDSKVITGMPPHRVFKLGLHRTFQIPRLFGSMTVIENMLIPPSKQLGESIWAPLLFYRRVQKQEDELIAQARYWLELVGLESMVNHPASALSGGQSKLLEVARSMINAPKVVLLDEPTAGVNPVLVVNICKFIKEVRERDNVTFVMVSHDMRTVQNICDTAIVMANGKILATGTPSDVLNNQEVKDAYLGNT